MLRQPLSAEATVRTVVHSTEFVGALSRENRHESAQNNREAFGKAALQLATALTPESGYRNREALTLNLAGNVMSYIDAQYALDTTFIDDKDQLSTYRHHIEQFNHAVKDMVDAHPDLKFDEVLSFIHRVYLHQPGASRDKLVHCSQSIRGVLAGMQNEIGLEQMVGYLGYDYRTATEEEDLNHGVDIFVRTDAGWMGIDAKSSPFGEQEGRAKHPNDRVLILWTHLNGGDFNGTFRLPPEVVSEKAEIIKPLLEAHQKQLVAA